MSQLHHISIYNPETGEFTGRIIGASKDAYLDAMVPKGMAGIRGQFNRATHHVIDGEVRERTPEPPDDEHEWNQATGQFVLKAEIAAQRSRERQAKAKLAELDAAKIRPISELLLDAQNEPARARLAQLEAEAAQVREGLATGAVISKTQYGVFGPLTPARRITPCDTAQLKGRKLRQLKTHRPADLKCLAGETI